MTIDSINNGYVIDHIKAGKAMKIYELLELNKLDCQVALITNASSKKLGKKDIIKVNKLIDINFDSLAIVDPNITVNVVKNDKIVEKKKIDLPERIVNVKKCGNPRCITSIESGLDNVFVLTDKEKKIYRCLYCESQAKDCK